jgi:cytochrome P450
MVTRIGAQDGPVNIEPVCSYAAADVIFRTLFSVPIEDEMVQSVYQAFQRYQSAQPLLNTGAFVGRRAWGLGRAARRSAREIRKIIGQMVERRARQIADGDAPDDLATRIMTTADPETGQRFSKNEMLDQVAIFFLAGHETSAAALGWALYLATLDPECQDQLAQDAQHLEAGRPPKALQITAHFKETLRLYPPVPMMVRTV